LSLATVASLAANAVTARAAEPDFGTPTIEGSLGAGLEVTQPVTFDAIPDRVELLITYADDPGPRVIELAPPASTGAVELRHVVAEEDGHLAPNTPIAARVRVTVDGVVTLGPTARTLFADERFDWQTARGDAVRVHWYEGSRAFGERALRIGEQAIAETAELLGVTEESPVDFFIYADRGAFYDALGPGARENVGGQANSDIRTMFALIGPSAIDDPWVGIVVPHELVHLVFDTAVDNPYHFPPRWLNEGLSTYLSQGYDADDRAAVEAGARSGELIPLDGLTGQFPTSAERFSLAYSESVSAVDFLIRTHGQDALVSLIRSYADGRTDDEAFQAAIGIDVTAFGDAWLADLGAVAPTRHGPRPAPDGPVPADWAGAPGTPGVTGVPAPTATAAVRPGTSGEPSTADTGRSTQLPSWVLIGGVGLAVVGLVVGAALMVRRSGRPDRSQGRPPVAPGP
jgi:hypothetical protein